MACKFCNTPLYIKVVQYAAPMLAPLTEVGELRQRLESLTGERYAELPKIYCPVCGEKVGSAND